MLRVCTLHFKIALLLDNGHLRAEICSNVNIKKNTLTGSIPRRSVFVGLFHFIKNEIILSGITMPALTN
jgi:hypothetical protein